MRIRSFVVALALLLIPIGCGDPLPGQAEFEAASEQVRSDSIMDPAYGNTPAAEERAEKVQIILTELDRQLFTTKAMTANEKFMVYCQHSKEGVAFLIHVPQFKRYQDDVRDTLLDAAWAAAAVATEDLQARGPLRLGVGLRGTNSSYGAVMHGPAGGERTFEMGKYISTDPLYPFFAAPAVEPAPKKEEPKEEPKKDDPPPPPPVPAKMQVRTEYVHKLDKAAVDAEILAHDPELQACAKDSPEGNQYDYVVEIKADGKVKKLSPRTGLKHPEPLTACLLAASKTWVFPNKDLKPVKPDTATITFGNVSGPLK